MKLDQPLLHLDFQSPPFGVKPITWCLLFVQYYTDINFSTGCNFNLSNANRWEGTIL
jgi:hypothetical protein